MLRTIEAVVETDGRVRLLEPVALSAPQRALVTILGDEAAETEPARLSEPTLTADWNRPEEGEAWQHLQ